MVLQVWVVTGCTRYSLEVAGAVTSRPLPPPLGHPHLHELITRQHTRVSSQRFLLYFTLLFSSRFLFFSLPSLIFSLICKSSFSRDSDLLTTFYARFIFSLVVTVSIHDSRYVSIVVVRFDLVDFLLAYRPVVGEREKCNQRFWRANWRNIGIGNF